VAARIRERYKGERHMIIGRSANLTAPIPGRTQCQFRNRCWEGCPFGGYFSTQSSTLPAAVATGKLTVRPYSIVTRILYDKDKKKATGVEVLDAETNQTYTYHAKVVFVNASALNSAWVLMNSATDIWPGGLGSSSGELGHNIMDHHYNVGASGVMEGYEDKYYYGRRANGIYIVRFANSSATSAITCVVLVTRGSEQGRLAAQRSGDEHRCRIEGGVDGTRGMDHRVTGFGELLPYHENKITLDKNKKDKWGLPVLCDGCRDEG
jgi:choline dehydrogenase-like flavoprotein